LNIENLFANKLQASVSVRPQNIVRFYEKALKAIRS
jgi:hypothetical protein